MPTFEVQVVSTIRLEAASAVLAGITAVDEVRRAWEGEDTVVGVADCTNITAQSEAIREVRS
jgi:hypothetical protein